MRVELHNCLLEMSELEERCACCFWGAKLLLYG